MGQWKSDLQYMGEEWVSLETSSDCVLLQQSSVSAGLVPKLVWAVEKQEFLFPD